MLNLLGLRCGTDGGLREVKENAGDPVSTGETGELVPLNDSNAACLALLMLPMSEATELRSPG